MFFFADTPAQVDVAVVEVGIGGLCDATNFVRRPAGTAITAIGIDHVASLGSTVAEIALQKAGIMKPGVPCVVCPEDQPLEALDVFRKRAAALSAPLCTVRPLPPSTLLGIAGAPQRHNAATALALSRLARAPYGFDSTAPSAAECDALAHTELPGRCQVISRGCGVNIFVDGAHTLDSVAACTDWFARTSKAHTRVLMLAITGGRDPVQLVAPLAHLHALYAFSNTLAVSLDGADACAVRKALCSAGIPCDAHCAPSPRDALAWLDAHRAACNNDVDCLVTGSMYLVGAILDEIGLPPFA
jgi:dihydrofolate synthase/folylpolyglutamate synthase